MNPMVFTIAVRENEAEIQREVQKKRRFGAGAIPNNGHEGRHESRRSIFAWISRIRKDISRSSSECSQEGCY